jgi:hypothetical protein
MVQIYVELLDEGTSVWRPVEATEEGDGLYRIIKPNPIPEGEHWQFPLGAVVRCKRTGSERRRVILFACEQVR